jgi:M6 family metalloprotease-like protein
VGDTVNVCAILIEFVPDEVTGTSGDGTMESAFPDSLVIDPLPHDRAYFEDHLSFLRHYYETVSKGKLLFGRMDVYPAGPSAVYRVTHPMWHYNYNTDDELLNQRLTELFVEALQLADPDVDFAHYDAVVVFHAGVGRDFNLGYDETPFDLPSAQITPADFRKYLPEYPNGFQTHEGIVVDKGLLLPEGESQAGYELSLNGIMVKLFGNWLGLPDLFDTQTGNSGIGRWGMMDQGSGNVFALVPAMPEAWSRTFMGWEIPDTIWATANPETLHVKRLGEADAAPEILLVPISDSEYYLVENRANDPMERGYVECQDRQGRRMRITLNGEVAFLGDGFGVTVEADNYDFGIPGSGILIWHIDETKIQEGLADNTVNTDPDHRGVDLVEADGAQDIGEEYGIGSAGGGTELGAPEDAWWDDNDYHKEANGNALRVAFNNFTFPPARTYDEAYSWYEFSDFSAIFPVMTFTIQNASRVPGFPIEVPPILADSLSVFPGDFNGDGESEMLLAGSDSTVYVLDSTANPRAIHLPKWDNLRIADLNLDGQDELILGGSRLHIVENLLDEPYTLYSFSHSLRAAIYNHLCIGSAGDSSARILAIVESDSGSRAAFELALFDEMAHLLDTSSFPGDTIWHVTGVVALEPPPSRLWAIGYESQTQGELLAMVSLSDEIEIGWTQQGSSGFRPLACVAAEAETLLWYDGGWRDRLTGEIVKPADCFFSYEILDWDGDGAAEVIADGKACHLKSGLPVEEFPTRLALKRGVAADFDGDGLPDLFGSNKGWHLLLHDLQEPRGFPMATFGIHRFIFQRENDPFVETTSIASPSYFRSGTTYLDMRKIAVGGTAGPREIYCPYPDPASSDPNPTFFYSIAAGQGAAVYSRSNWVYPWPNPANEISHIRLTFPYPVQAHIRIFDIAGHLIDELSSASSSAGPFEVPWDVSRISSGVYIGIVEAAGGGRSERAQIKIAVVK